MKTSYAAGQRVKFVVRCVLTKNLPRHSQGYQFTALRSAEEDKYTGEGIIDVGTPATIVSYASHGTGAASAPVVKVKGKIARCHSDNLEAY